MQYKDINDNYTAVMRRFAVIKGGILKQSSNWVTHTAQWEAVPTISADAKYGDVVNDKSIDSLGHVGVILWREEFVKRDGRRAVRFDLHFVAHTTVNNGAPERVRKVEFILA